MSAIIPTIGNLTIILSAELAELPDDINLDNSERLRRNLAQRLAAGSIMSLSVCDGAYKGRPERSFAFTASTSAALYIGLRLAEHYGQDSYLVVNPDSIGVLHYGNCDQEAIGHYQACRPNTTDAWTRVVATGECFTFI